MNLGLEIRRISSAFRKKEKLENDIKDLIHRYEDETGLKIVGVKFGRVETVKTHSPNYTEISIFIL